MSGHGQLSGRTRRLLLLGGAVAFAALVVVIALATRGEDAPRHADARTRTTTTRESRTTTSTTTTTTTTTPPVAPTAAPTAPGSTNVAPATGPGPGADVEPPPDTDPPSDPTQGGVTVSETPGTCRYDPATAEVQDSGIATNPGGEEAVVEVQVTWTDASGKADSWSDLVTVPGGGSADWTVSTDWVGTPQGLTCQTALV